MSAHNHSATECAPLSAGQDRPPRAVSHGRSSSARGNVVGADGEVLVCGVVATGCFGLAGAAWLLRPVSLADRELAGLIVSGCLYLLLGSVRLLRLLRQRRSSASAGAAVSDAARASAGAASRLCMTETGPDADTDSSSVTESGAAGSRVDCQDESTSGMSAAA